MKYTRPLLILFAAGTALLSAGPSERLAVGPTINIAAAKPVTVFFVRHAETGPRPERRLSRAGKARATALHRLVGKAGITHLFSSDYPRTRGMLAPLANATGLKVTLISPAKPGPQVAAIRALPGGAVAVVAGHSNTLPPLLARFGHPITGLTRRGFIVDDVHDRVFVLTLGVDRSSMVELRYGGGSGAGNTARPAAATAAVEAPTARVDLANVNVGLANSDRKSSSMFFYSRTAASIDVHGQFELTYGTPAWNPAHGEALRKAKAGDRLRLGNNFFATFDTSCAVDVGGGKNLAPGVYYLALERGMADAMSLVFLDPASIRNQKLNANQTSETRGGITAPMTWREVETPADHLKVELTRAGERGAKARLTIRFGKQELTGMLRAVID